MNALKGKGWEKPAAFVCEFWWIILIVVVLVVTAYFTRNYWMPALGLVSGL